LGEWKCFAYESFKFFFLLTRNDLQPKYLVIQVTILYGFRFEVTNDVFFIMSLCINICVPLDADFVE
jgi:hypothetical protein